MELEESPRKTKGNVIQETYSKWKQEEGGKYRIRGIKKIIKIEEIEYSIYKCK